MRPFLPAAFAGVLLAVGPLAAQTPRELARTHAPRPTRPAITSQDLMTRLYIFADDSMMGRAAGTPYNLRGTAYIERELRRLGLRPAGENGTFFQDVPLTRRELDTSTPLAAGGASFTPWRDYFPRYQGRGARSIDGVETVYGGTWGDSASLIPAQAAAGKLVVLALKPGASLSRGAIVARFASAAGIAVANADELSREDVAAYRQPSVGLAPSAARGPAAAVPSYLYITRAMGEALLGAPLERATPGAAGARVRGGIAFAHSPAPGRNVVAVLPGSDPRLRGQYVAIGAHNDHDPPAPGPADHDSVRVFNRIVRPGGAENSVREPTVEEWARIRAALDSLRRIRPARPDSILNGADDDASGSMAVLEIAEALATARSRPRRSVLFVWHTAEELGLLGSEYFTDHPTVPRDSIVAQLNLDMIGRGGAADHIRGGPRYLQIIGSRRLSTELGDLVEAANRALPVPFEFDYSYDANGHPQNFYCRSDHYMYARYGIPIAFFTTGGHRDYHMITDEPQYIDYEHYRRVTQLIHDVALRTANLDHRPVVDRPRMDPNAPCRQ
ncbi:MAG TPA: M28 family peptidase [Longimicrobiaceae bacterium]|nr:M28 family peptidase [Longimicrobiaceae bacterium]